MLGKSEKFCTLQLPQSNFPFFLNKIQENQNKAKFLRVWTDILNFKADLICRICSVS